MHGGPDEVGTDEVERTKLRTDEVEASQVRTGGGVGRCVPRVEGLL